MKKTLLAVGVVFFLLIVLLLALPFLIDLNQYQARYRPVIEDALDRKIELKNIRLTIFPRIGVRVAGFTVMDDPAFSTGPFASLNSLDIGVKLLPLLDKQVEVEEITLRDPVITVIKNKQGVLNTSTLGKKAPPGQAVSAQSAPAPKGQGPLHILTMLAVDRVALTGGKLMYRDQSAAKPSEYDLQNLEFLLTGVGLGKTARLHATTTVQPVNLPVKIDGTVGPLKETIEAEIIDLAIALGKTLLAIKGSDIGGDLKLNVTAPSINTADLPMVLPLKKPLEAKDLKMTIEVKDEKARMQNLSVNLLGGQLTSEGGLTTGSQAPPFDGKVILQGVQLGPILEAIGTDRVSISGTTASQLALHGAGFSMPDLTKSLEGTGHAVIKDGKIEGINLLKEAFALLKAAGVTTDVGSATVFSTIETNYGIKNGVIKVDRMLIDSHDYQATANGTIGFDKILNMKVNLSLSEGLSAKIAGSSPYAKMAMTGSRITVPMIITGPTQSPAYGLDTKALGTKAQEIVTKQAQERLGELLKGKGATPGGVEKGQDALKKLFGQ
jgi:AsmA protein